MVWDIEIRKDSNDDLYFIIGEVKTTKNTIGDYPDEIIQAFKKTPPKLFVYEVNFFKEEAKYLRKENLKEIVDRMPILFYKILQIKDLQV